MLSHLISLIDNPVRRHVIETLFREARGRKTEQLDREFLQSIGACRTGQSPAKLAEFPREFNTPQLSAESEAFHPRGFPRSASSPALPIPHSPAETSPVDETPAVLTPQEQLSAFRGELSELANLKSKLVQRGKVVTGETLLLGGNGAVEVIRCLDELLRERARREEWAGIDESRLNGVSESMAKMTNRELLSCNWVDKLGLSEASRQNFDLFLEYFRGKEGLVAPSLAAVQKAKRDLAGVSSTEVNWIREVFGVFAGEVIRRLRELTRTVAEEQAKRFAAVMIPAKPNPERSFVQKLPVRTSKKPWQTIPAVNSVPHSAEAFFPPIKSASPVSPVSPVSPGKGKILIPNEKNPKRGNRVSPSPAGKTISTTTSTSPVAEGVSSSSSSSLTALGRFNMPTLPTAKPLANSTNPKTAETWGVKKDLVQETLDQAVEETKRTSGKGKKKPVVLFQY